MYKRLPDLAESNPNAPVLAVTIDGTAFTARAGDSVAATLIAAGAVDCRTTPVSGAQRGPFCMMGVCFDCLVVIDGHPNDVLVNPGHERLKTFLSRIEMKHH